ncbi:MAG TPA: hypothetical protein VGB42_13095, partial [Candidatus Thermoplasmatota archaeon]
MVVTIGWDDAHVPDIARGSDTTTSAGGGAPLQINAHAMVLAAYDPGHVDGNGTPAPWGFVNSWADGGSEIYWMPDADFQQAWAHEIPFVGSRNAVVITRAGADATARTRSAPARRDPRADGNAAPVGRRPSAPHDSRRARGGDMIAARRGGAMPPTPSLPRPGAIVAVAAVALVVLGGPLSAQPGPATLAAGGEPVPRWFKGDTHAHTTNSDGDSPPEVVTRWYQDHGYNFLVLSDHNYLTAEGSFPYTRRDDFILIQGEEVTAHYQPPGTTAKHPIHVNALNLKALIEPWNGSDAVETLQRNVDRVRDAGAVPHVNHPSFRWALTASDLLRVSRYRLLEIWNG